ncbi:MAG TPA: aminopeptidase P family N-terminal domain-containing protein, partial [Candidatus Limnocylindrales bacterium]
MPARLAVLDLPTFPRAEVAPELPPSIYPARLERLRERAEARGYDRLVVYADREHSANLAWLTGFDPRFEEAILVLGATGRPVLLGGNECIGLARVAPLPVEAVLFQELSLPSQPRERSRPLGTILQDAGVAPG